MNNTHDNVNTHNILEKNINIQKHQREIMVNNPYEEHRHSKASERQNGNIPYFEEDDDFLSINDIRFQK